MTGLDLIKKTFLREKDGKVLLDKRIQEFFYFRDICRTDPNTYRRDEHGSIIKWRKKKK